MCIQLRTRNGILTLQILLAQLGATGHQDDAEHIGATSVADAPERVAPVVSFDELGVAGREELGGKVATLGKLRRDDVGHHANADAVPVSPDVDAAASLLGGTRALRRRNAIVVGTIGGLRSLIGVLARLVGDRPEGMESRVRVGDGVRVDPEVAQEGVVAAERRDGLAGRVGRVRH